METWLRDSLVKCVSEKRDDLVVQVYELQKALMSMPLNVVKARILLLFKAAEVRAVRVWTCELEETKEVDNLKACSASTLTDHKKKDCLFKTAQCWQWKEKKYIRPACKNFVHHDGFNYMQHSIPGVRQRHVRQHKCDRAR